MNDKKAAKLYEAMVNAAYDYKFEGGSKELASKAASEYAEYKGISYEQACSRVLLIKDLRINEVRKLRW